MNPIFPLAKKNTSYKTNFQLTFGSTRDVTGQPGKKRKHAAVDLAATAGTAVYAVEDGDVIEIMHNFKFGTSLIAVWHGDIYEDDSFIVRYGEVDQILFKEGATVKKGQQIASVGVQTGGTQLHFEMYSGNAFGDFHTNTLPYMRRADLLDPTPYLDAWQPQP